MKAKLKELRDKEPGHLEHELAETQKHLYDLRSQAVTEKLEDPSQIGKARRHIAQLKTLIREKKTATTTAAAPAK
jgi:large subunit ribosomal protein L29